MFVRSLLCVGLLLTVLSICVESVKRVGPNDLSAKSSIARNSELKGPTKDYGCFLGLSNDQEETVNQLGESLKWCDSTESRAKQELDDDVKKFHYELASSADEMCVKVDRDCRDEFAKTNDARGAMGCFAEMRKFTLPILLNITEDAKLKLLTVENLNHSIVATKRECNLHAGFDYVRDSGINFENFIGCEQPSSEISTTLLTTQSVPTTTPINDRTWAEETTTEGNRFPWNK